MKKKKNGASCSPFFKDFEKELKGCGEKKFNLPTLRKMLVEECRSEEEAIFRRLLSRRILSQYHRQDIFGNNHKKEKIKYLVGEKVYILRFLNGELLERG